MCTGFIIPLFCYFLYNFPILFLKFVRFLHISSKRGQTPFRRCLTPFTFFSQLTLKYRDSICRQRICNGIFLTVAFLFHRFIDQWPLFAFSTVFLIITVEHQFKLFPPRHAHAVVRPLHWREIAHKEKILLPVLGMSHKAVNAAETVIRIDPLESLGF